jgi:hypothetical protein
MNNFGCYTTRNFTVYAGHSALLGQCYEGLDLWLGWRDKNCLRKLPLGTSRMLNGSIKMALGKSCYNEK